ncbi:hypothetical protein HK105_208904 [Polyrhizophydium stewartii]|uniref:Tctex1 domain-containing protein 2 n=1 Tax=Polyrhizophydium stewartii TaxID=2732419 RepID=A0ABR4MWI0_9FUNG
MNDESDDDIYARNPAGAADSDDGSAGDEGDGAFGADAAQRSPKPVIVVVPTSAAGLDVDVDVPTRPSAASVGERAMSSETAKIRTHAATYAVKTTIRSDARSQISAGRVFSEATSARTVEIPWSVATAFIATPTATRHGLHSVSPYCYHCGQQVRETQLSSPAINPLLICQMTLFQGHFGDNCAMTRGFGRMSAFYEDPSEPKVPSSYSVDRSNGSRSRNFTRDRSRSRSPARFRPAVVSKSIHQVLADRLTGATYHPDTCSQWTREIADEIKNKLKELELPRYKYIVHVTMGEMRGEGVRIGTRCFWDADTDNIAQDAFMNVG